jgi:class 3 adenylate cyclase
LRALQAGKELLRATRSLLARPLDSADPPVVQPLALGVGIECGQAVVGSFGPARRRAHTALGEPVGVASRLQHMTQDLSMPLLIGPQLAAQLPKQGTEHLGDYLLEGMTRQYAVYAPADWVDLVPSEQLWSRATTSSRSAAVDEAPFSAPTSAHDPQHDSQQDPHRQHGA